MWYVKQGDRCFRRIAKRYVLILQLAPSGGWVFDVTSNVSDATGLWDVIIVSAIFVLGWATLRLSPKEISLVLGNVFDVTIPLQHQREFSSSRQCKV